MSVVTIYCRSEWTRRDPHDFSPCCDATPEIFDILAGGKKKRKTREMYGQCTVCGQEVYALEIDFAAKWERYRKKGAGA